MYLSDPRDRFPPRERSFHLPVYISIRNYEAERCNASSLRVLTKSYTVRDTGERTQAEALTRL